MTKEDNSSFFLFYTYNILVINMSKETFKSFARNHTELANYVMNGKTNWQKLYELYEIYGENSNIWSEYFKDSPSTLSETTDLSSNIKELMQNIKNIDLNSVQKGITNIQKALGLLQDIGLGQGKIPESTYEPRPLYQHFDD